MTEKGHPVVSKLTPGQVGDAPHAADLLTGQSRGEVKAVVADRGYDRDANVALVRRLRVRVVIHPVARRGCVRRYSRPGTGGATWSSGSDPR